MDLTIRPAAWSVMAEGHLQAATVCDPACTLAELRAQVDNGQAALREVVDGAGQVIGCVILRIERRAAGNVGVIVAAGGRLKGVNLVRTCLQAVEQSFIGVQWIRIHTARRGLVRTLAKRGYEFQEFVLCKPVV